MKEPLAQCKALLRYAARGLTTMQISFVKFHVSYKECLALQLKLEELRTSLKWRLVTTKTNPEKEGKPVNYENLVTKVAAF